VRLPTDLAPPRSSLVAFCVVVHEEVPAVGCPDFVRQWEGPGTCDGPPHETPCLTNNR